MKDVQIQLSNRFLGCEFDVLVPNKTADVGCFLRSDVFEEDSLLERDYVCFGKLPQAVV